MQKNKKQKKKTTAAAREKQSPYPLQSLQKQGLELAHTTSAGGRVQSVRLLKRVEPTLQKFKTKRNDQNQLYQNQNQK